MDRLMRLGVAIALTIGMAACERLPAGAAIQADIEREVKQADSGFAFYPVTRDLLPSVQAWPAVNSELFNGWPRRTAGSTGTVIAPGDTINVSLWDSSENSLLTPPGARTATLGELVVSPEGRVFLPYVGDVRVEGMSPTRAREVVQSKLEGISPSAQVMLTQTTGQMNSVDLVAGVAQPGSYPLPSRNYSVLGMIAQGGGIPPGLNNPMVKLQRGSNVYAISLERLYDNPEADAIVVGGDKLIVEEDDRYFLSIGAAGREEQVYFNDQSLSALDAIAQIGGVADTRADPTGILILREYPRSAVAAGMRGPREERVIFSINLTTADGLFAAKTLNVMPGDVVLATESPVNNLRTALGLIGSVFGVASAVEGFGD